MRRDRHASQARQAGGEGRGDDDPRVSAVCLELACGGPGGHLDEPPQADHAFLPFQRRRIDRCVASLRQPLSGPTSSAGRAVSDGAKPGPGGWNRIHLIVDDLESEITRLEAEGVSFRNEVVTGPGGSQVLICDPSGNLVELLQPAARP